MSAFICAMLSVLSFVIFALTADGFIPWFLHGCEAGCPCEAVELNMIYAAIVLAAIWAIATLYWARNKTLSENNPAKMFIVGIDLVAMAQLVVLILWRTLTTAGPNICAMVVVGSATIIICLLTLRLHNILQDAENEKAGETQEHGDLDH